MHIASKIISYDEAKKIAKDLHVRGKKIVFKTGCFDILHVAHARMLAYAKSCGDVLIIGVGSDETLRALKGSDRPIFPATYRAELLAAFADVDYVVILDEPLQGRIDHEKIISLVRPDYYLLPPDDKALPEKQLMASTYGVSIILKPEIKSDYANVPVNTSDIIEKLRKL